MTDDTTYTRFFMVYGSSLDQITEELNNQFADFVTARIIHIERQKTRFAVLVDLEGGLITINTPVAQTYSDEDYSFVSESNIA